MGMNFLSFFLFNEKTDLLNAFSKVRKTAGLKKEVSKIVFCFIFMLGDVLMT